MRFACGITKARIQTQFRLFDNYCFSTATMVKQRDAPQCYAVLTLSSGILRSLVWLSRDVSGLSVPSSRVSCLRSVLGQLILKMGPIGSRETSVFNQHTLRNISEDDRIYCLLFILSCFSPPHEAC